MSRLPNSNKFGLARRIPDPIKRLVRQNCGFGCVNCGYAYCEYHHFDPPFENAQIHDPMRIMLLCGKCHDLEKRGVLSDSTLQAKFKNPMCRDSSWARAELDIGANGLQVAVGPVVVRNACQIIRIYDDDVLAILPPEESGRPFRITATISNREGNPVFVMNDNIWEAGSSAWDVELEGSRIIVRLAHRDVLLKLRQEPPDRLVVERINLNHRDVSILAVEGKSLSVRLDDGRGFESGEGYFDGCEAAFYVDKNGLAIGLNHREASFAHCQLKT